MGYYPPNGQFPQGYPGGGMGMGSYPGGMANPMMGRGGRQGMGQYTPTPGGVPGQMPMGQMPMGQMPMGQMPMGQMPMGQTPMGQMPMGQMPMGQMPTGQMPMGQMQQQPMGSGGGSRLFKKGGQGMPGGMPMGGMQQPQQMPGMQPMGQQMGQQMGARGKRPGIISRMANQQQQGYQPAVQAPTYSPQSPYSQGGAAGRSARFQRFSGMQQQAQPMTQMPVAAPQPAVSSTGKPIKPKQFNLKGPSGVNGTGIARITGPNSFSLVANDLPDPESLAQNYPNLGPNPVYVAYLTNRKGRDSFTVGQLMPVGAGTYRGSFQSNVPFYDHEQVVVTLENPYNIQNNPTGPVILTSGGGAAALALPKPVKRFFGGVWEKVKGVGKGIGKKKDEPTPEFTPTPEAPAAFETPSFLSNYNLAPTAPPPVSVPPISAPGPQMPAATPPVSQTYQPQTYQPQTYQPQTYQPPTYQLPASQPQLNTDLPGLGPALEDPSPGGNP